MGLKWCARPPPDTPNSSDETRSPQLNWIPQVNKRDRERLLIVHAAYLHAGDELFIMASMAQGFHHCCFFPHNFLRRHRGASRLAVPLTANLSATAKLAPSLEIPLGRPEVWLQIHAVDAWRLEGGCLHS